MEFRFKRHTVLYFKGFSFLLFKPPQECIRAEVTTERGLEYEYSAYLKIVSGFL